MANLIVLIISGICAFVSFYMVYAMIKTGDGSIWLFLSFGLLFGIPFAAALIKLISRKSDLFKRIDTVLAGKPETRTTFVPHWFMMAVMIIAAVIILLSIIIPLFFKK